MVRTGMVLATHASIRRSCKTVFNMHHRKASCGCVTHRAHSAQHPLTPIVLEHTMDTESPLTRVVGLFSLYTFHTTQPSTSAPALYASTKIPIPIGTALWYIFSRFESHLKLQISTSHFCHYQTPCTGIICFECGHMSYIS